MTGTDDANKFLDHVSEDMAGMTVDRLDAIIRDGFPETPIRATSRS